MTIKELKLDDIRIDGGTQARAALDQSTVSEYAEAMEGGAAFPPVTVFFDGADRWLADGFHRYFGAKKIGCLSIGADERAGTRRDAILFSYGANAQHGLRRTNADKRKAVEDLLADSEWSKWSDRQIAKVACVSVPFVGAMRRPEVKEKQKNQRHGGSKQAAGCNPITPIEDVGVLVESDSPDPQSENALVDTQSGGAQANSQNRPPRARGAHDDAPEHDLEDVVQALTEENAELREEIDTLKRAADPDQAKKIAELKGYIKAVERQRDDWMGQCAQLRREIKALHRKLGVKS